MTPAEANTAIREALEIWQEWWPYVDQLDDAAFEYHLRCIDAGLRYIAKEVTG